MDQEKNESELQIDLGGIFFFVFHKLWIVLICLIIGLAGGLTYGILTKHDLYSTNATILASYNDSSVADQTSNQTKVASILGGCVTCVRQNRFAKAVAREMNENPNMVDGNGKRYNVTYEDIMSSVSYSYSIAAATLVSEGNYIYITTTADTPKEAYDILQTVTNLFPNYISENYPITDAETLRFSCVNDIDMPVEPVSNTSILTYTLVAGLGCAVLCILVLAVIFVVDKRVKGEEDLTAKYNIAVLGSVPDFEDKELVSGGGY